MNTRKQIILCGAIMMTAATAAFADDNTTISDTKPLFHANELSLDLFGMDAINKYTIDNPSGDRIRHNSRLGAGMGLNYFVTRYVGFGGEAFTENTAHSFVDNASGSLIVRIPIEPIGLSPYVYGGGGHQFDPEVASFVHAGAGLEWRFTRYIGVFADGRYVFTDRTRNYGVARAGLRFSF